MRCGSASMAEERALPVSTPEIPHQNVDDTCAARGPMALKLLRELPSDLKFREEWNSLVESMESPQVFYTWEWAQAMCLAYGNQGLLLLTAHRAKNLVGVVALTRNRAGEVSFITATTADYCDFISAPQDRKEFVHLAIAKLRDEGVEAFQFANLSDTSFSVAAINAAMPCTGYRFYSRPAYRCARIRFSSQVDRLEADKAARRRKSKSPQSLRSAEVLHMVNWGEWAVSFDDFAAAHVGRFLAEGKISNLACSERRKFLCVLGELLDEKNWLAASMIKVNGKSVSWHFGMRFAGAWFWYQPAFDCDWLHTGPGTYLLNDLIQQAAKDPACDTIDLGLGDEGYKQRYVTSVQQTLHVYAHRSAVQVTKTKWRHRTANLIKRWPRLEKTLRKSLKRIFSDGEGRAPETLEQLMDARSEITAFSWPRQRIQASNLPTSGYKLELLSLRLLALAAMKYERDAPTIAYLLRCAAWLKSGNKEGIALLDLEGVAVHFCRAVSFSSIPMRLTAKVEMPGSDAILISDSWTPNFDREKHLQYLAIIAERISECGREAWVLASTRDRNFTSNLGRSGFISRFTIPRRSRRGMLHIWRQKATQPGEPLMDFDTAA